MAELSGQLVPWWVWGPAAFLALFTAPAPLLLRDPILSAGFG